MIALSPGMEQIKKEIAIGAALDLNVLISVKPAPVRSWW
jgi:transcriptional regulator with GAF, ATPase, and Fis domain